MNDQLNAGKNNGYDPQDDVPQSQPSPDPGYQPPPDPGYQPPPNPNVFYQNQYGYQQPFYPIPPKEPADGKAVASMVLGIISDVLLIFVCCMPYLSLIPSIVGLIMGVLSKKTPGSSTRAVGLATNIIALVLSLLLCLLVIILLFTADESYWNNYWVEEWWV